jgi:hypothetical protein
VAGNYPSTTEKSKNSHQNPEFLYVSKTWIWHNATNTIPKGMVYMTKEESPLAGSNRGPQDIPDSRGSIPRE